LLAYSRRSAGVDRVVRTAIGILAQDSRQERLLATPPDMDLVPDDWSADGTRLLAACRTRGSAGHGICVLPVDGAGTAAVQVLAAHPDLNLICPRFSPDQRWISFMAVEKRRRTTATLYVMPAAGGPWTRVTGGNHYDDKPRWAPDGRTIYFVSDRGGFANIWGRRFDRVLGRPDGEPFQVTRFDRAAEMIDPYLGRVEIAVSRDRLFLPITETSSQIWVLTGLDSTAK
jgi:dipeptidyl aminopeptidase/acylaminoacyl peptidase